MDSIALCAVPIDTADPNRSAVAFPGRQGCTCLHQSSSTTARSGSGSALCGPGAFYDKDVAVEVLKMGLRDVPGLVNQKFGKLYSALREPFIEPVATLDFKDPPWLFSSFNY
jgi:hypothetical protein